MTCERLGFRVVGVVQGVGFRAATVAAARRLGVAGFVRNCPDGSVAGEVQGAPEQLAAFLRWLAEGPPLARVDRVDSSPVGVVPGAAGFAVRRDPAT